MDCHWVVCLMLALPIEICSWLARDGLQREMGIHMLGTFKSVFQI